MLTIGTVGRRTRTLLGFALAWLFIAALLTLQFWPDLPRSRTQWVLLIVFGPPFYAFGELLFGRLFQRHGRSISHGRFSFKRVLIALAVTLPFVVVCWWLSWLLLTMNDR